MNQRYSAELRTPPHNDEAEEMLLGCVFLDPGILRHVAARVKVKDFWREAHRETYQTILTLHAQGLVPDQLGVLDHITQTREVSKEEVNRVMRLSSLAPTSVYWDRYAQIVADRAKVRRYIERTHRHVDEAYSINRPVKEFFADVHADIAELAKENKSRDYVSGKEAMETFLKDYKRRVETGEEGGMSCGCKAVDDLLGDFHTGRSIMLAGLSKQGKTKLTAQIVFGLAWEQEIAVDWYSVEMPPEDMMCRALSYFGGIEEDRLRNPNATGTEQDTPFQRRFNSGLIKVAKVADRIRFYSSPRPRLQDILLNTEIRKEELGDDMPLVVVVDYIQRVDAGHTGQSAEYANVTEASQMLTGAAIEHDFLGIYVSHFNRGAANRGGMPKASDARGSGAIEQDCNHFVIVHRPFWDSDEAGDDGDWKRSFTVLKQSLNRHGPTGRTALQADLGRNVFKDWEGPMPDFKGGDQ